MTGAELVKALREAMKLVGMVKRVDGLELEVAPNAFVMVLSADAIRMRRMRAKRNNVTDDVRNRETVTTFGTAFVTATDPSSPPHTPPLLTQQDLPSGSSLSDPDPESYSALRSSSEDLTGSARVAAKRVARRRWTRVPEGFEPTAEHELIAAERGVDLRGELAQFRDHEFARPKSDADATFRNWLRKALPVRNGVRNGSQFLNRAEQSQANVLAVLRRAEAEEQSQ